MKAALKKLAAAVTAAVTAVFGAALPHSARAALAAETAVQTEDKLTVSLLVLGDTVHKVTDENKHTLSGGGLTEWLRGDFEASAEDTVWDVVKAAFEQNDISYVNESGSYLESAAKDGVTLGGGTNGELCGWMYNLNGGFAMNGMAEQPLADGDSIVLYFTDDFYAEDGSEHPSYGTSADKLTVSLLVLGDTAHEVTDENKHTLSGGGLTEWLRGDFEASSEDTVWDVVKSAFEQNDISYVNESGSYLESAAKDGVTLGGGTNGELCGWMYNLNGGFAMNGMAEQPLADGDRIVLYFTDDFYAEDGSEHPSYNTSGNKPEAPEKPGKPVVKYDIAEMYEKTGDALFAELTAAGFPAGTEWSVMGLARSGRTVPDGCYNNVLEYVSSKIDENGRLSRTGATENVRFILALTALGYDVTNVGGNDLLLGLSELEYVTKQGANGAIWALIALDSGKYDVPKAKNGTQTTREALVEAVMAARLEGGGWAYSGSTADPDLTAMALTALAPYIGESVDKTEADKALALLSELQNENGGFGGEDGTYSESCAQVLTALTALGIDPLTDERFIKNGRTVIDAMAELYEDGKFRHNADGELNTLSTEQCFYAMAAYDRFINGKTAFYDMTDAQRRPAPGSTPSKPDANPACGVSDGTVVVALTAAAFMVLLRRRGK